MKSKLTLTTTFAIVAALVLITLSPNLIAGGHSGGYGKRDWSGDFRGSFKKKTAPVSLQQVIPDNPNAGQGGGYEMAPERMVEVQLPSKAEAPQVVEKKAAEKSMFSALKAWF